MREGYFELGEAKGICYMILSAVSAVLFLIFSGRKLISPGRIPGDMLYCLMAVVFSNMVSFFFSVDKKIAFFGLEGWRNGLSTVLLVLFFFYAYYDKENAPNKYILAAVMITPFLECVLAILHRIGIYPFEIYGTNPGFLATIGNINWFTAYLSVFVPLGIGIMFHCELFSREYFIAAVYVMVSLLALLMQGSDSAFIVIGACCGVLLFISLTKRQDFRKFLTVVFTLGFAMELGALLITVFRDGYVYQVNLLMNICLSHAGAILMALCLLLYRSSRLFEEIKLPFKGGLYRGLAASIIVGCAVVFGILNFKNLDYSSGNGRILIYSICLDMFGGMDPMRKLFGAGQDCLSSYAYSDPVTSEALFNVFGFDTLTNAHCDLLTILIERGLLGVLTYLALIFSFIKKIFGHKNKHAATLCALILASFFLNSLVSFSLVVSAPYFYLAMALGLSCEES